MDNQFRIELSNLINRHSLENGSNTPDFILARYLEDCLRAFDTATKHRDYWWGPGCPDGFDPETAPPIKGEDDGKED